LKPGAGIVFGIRKNTEVTRLKTRQPRITSHSNSQGINRIRFQVRRPCTARLLQLNVMIEKSPRIPPAIANEFFCPVLVENPTQTRTMLATK